MIHPGPWQLVGLTGCNRSQLRRFGPSAAPMRQGSLVRKGFKFSCISQPEIVPGELPNWGKLLQPFFFSNSTPREQGKYFLWASKHSLSNHVCVERIKLL